MPAVLRGRFSRVSRNRFTNRVHRREELKRQNERLSEFASILSHDLQSPLNAAEGRVQLARETCESEHLDAVVRAHDRMATLIDDILTLSQEGKTVATTESVDLATVTEECWRTIEAADATLVIETDQAIEADKSRLKQVFENLFRNSVEHGGQEVTVTVGTHPDGFYVADDGPGIPAEDPEDVFDVGYSTSDGGTGFGLSIVRRMIEAHGWEVSVAESPDGGARFEVTNSEFEAE